MSRKQELLGKLIIMKEFCDYMTIVNWLDKHNNRTLSAYYEIYFECRELLMKNV